MKFEEVLRTDLPGRVEPSGGGGNLGMSEYTGSRHEWVPGESWDLMVTLDNATSKIYSAFFVAEEGTMSTFRALTEVIVKHGLFCALYADRGLSLLAHARRRRQGGQGQSGAGTGRSASSESS